MKSTIKVIDGHQVMVNPTFSGAGMILALERDRHMLTVVMSEDQINALMFSMECALQAMRMRRARAAA